MGQGRMLSLLSLLKGQRMTAIEDACRWSIVHAYCINWRLHTHYSRQRMRDYAVALGLTLLPDKHET